MTRRSPSRRSKLFAALAVALFAAPAVPAPAVADEGMWLFSNPPTKALEAQYGFKVTPEWLLHLQQSAVRFNSGGSGSFVSADGLVMTNHHVGADAIAKLSSADRDLLKTGFHARTRGEELKCLDLELNVLQSYEDVTARVNEAVKPGMNAADAQRARQAVMNTIEQEAAEKTGLRCDVVTLYQGGRYHLYRYKKYTDVRLVFAPEQEIAFFGGDPDNFEYPRFDLDITFFRAYENGAPAKVPHHLTWAPEGVKDGDLVFVAGHPGRTNRLDTVAHLEFLRDRVYPLTLDITRRRENLLANYGERSIENGRRAKDELFGYENSRKARLGGLQGLQTPSVIEAKRAAEAKLREAVRRDPTLADLAGAWAEVDAAIAAWRELHVENLLLESGAAFNTEAFAHARTIVRLADESTKDNAVRLREYRSTNLESLEQALYSEAPLYADLETVKLADSLSMLAEMLGGDHPLVQQILDGKSPAVRADELIRGTKLFDPAERKRLGAGGVSAVAASDDPLIRLARLVDGPARAVREKYESRVAEPLRQGYAKIAQAQFAVLGADRYPDATFTLRLAYGTVRGYEENGRPVPPWTTLGGTFTHAEKAQFRPPFNLPESWLKAREKLAGDTPFNFVSTADIIGGNSGSPVVNRQGQVVGIIFDGNIQSLVLDFAFTDQQARAVSVDARGIVEALKSVYGATELVTELTAKP